MRRFFTFQLLPFALLLAFASAKSLRAQEASPKPAARSVPPISDTQDGSQTPAGSVQPDSAPPTGILAPTLGTPVLEHSFVTFGAQFGSTIQSPGAGPGGWYSDNYFLGNLTLVKNWRQGITSINYSGGEYVSTNSSTGNGNYQNVSFFQNVRSARWDLTLVDAFAYLPQSQFGFGGGTNIGQPGIGGTLSISPPGISTGPSQDIFSANGPRYMNNAAAQATYTLTGKDSFTLNGSYGLLNFSDSGNLNSTTISAFHFSDNPQAFGSHSAGLAYGRKLTGKLAVQLSGGAQINNFRIPENGSNSRSLVSGFGSANLSYGLRNGNLTLTYSHGLSNGSGVLVGSQMDQVSLSAGHKFGRVWNGFANFGYSRNTPIGNFVNINNSTYNDWFLGAGLGRPFGRSIMFALAYTANFERADQPGCTGSQCTDFTQQMITLSLQWHARPFVLR
jgi:hypothetical protein